MVGADQQIGDDLIVTGDACVGSACANGESFGANDSLWLKEQVVRLKFDDTSTDVGMPANDWQLTANDAASSGANKFSVEDVTGNKTPYTILAGAQNDTLFVSTGTKVGIGTATPSGRLHLYGPADSDVFAGMGVDLNAGPAFNFGYAGGSYGRSAGFFNIRPDASATAPNPSLRLSTANVQRMIIDNEGFIGIGTNVSAFNPTAPIHHMSGAMLTAGGAWQNASSRAHKHGVRPLDGAAATAAFADLVPVRFRYDEEPGDEYLGFIAEDVPELVASRGRTTLSAMDLVALLTKVVQEQQVTMRKQDHKLRELGSKVDELAHCADRER